MPPDGSNPTSLHKHGRQPGVLEFNAQSSVEVQTHGAITGAAEDRDRMRPSPSPSHPPSPAAPDHVGDQHRSTGNAGTKTRKQVREEQERISRKGRERRARQLTAPPELVATLVAASVIITVDSDDDAEMEEVSKRQSDESRERREKKAKKKRDEAQQRQSRKQSGIEAFLTRKPD